jgi:hypothetical protein
MEGNGRGACGNALRGQHASLIRRYALRLSRTFGKRNYNGLFANMLNSYAMMSKTAVHHYTGTNIELGTACGKLFRCSTMAILDAGDSDILSDQA